MQRETVPFQAEKKLSFGELLVIAEHAEESGLLGTAANIIKPVLTQDLINKENIQRI